MEFLVLVCFKLCFFVLINPSGGGEVKINRQRLGGKWKLVLLWNILDEAQIDFLRRKLSIDLRLDLIFNFEPFSMLQVPRGDVSLRYIKPIV